MPERDRRFGGFSLTVPLGLGFHGVDVRVRRFVDDTRAGATAFAAVAVTIMTVAGAALITDHAWLVDQRDVLKAAADAASIAATLDIDRQLARNPSMSDADLKAKLLPVAKRYIEVNLVHLAPGRLARAKETLEIALELDRTRRTVVVTAQADLGGTLFARALPLLGAYQGPEAITAKGGVESESSPVEVVLAIDMSSSMAMDLAGQWHSSAESRMDIVKRAAKNLVAILDPNGYNRVAVGVVPWHVNVRLDAATTATWTRKRWARYPSERTYPVPYTCGGKCTVRPVVHTLPASPPQAWLGCLDGHRLSDRQNPGRALLPEPTAAALFALPRARNPFAQSYFPPGDAISYSCLAASDMPTGATNLCLAPRPERAQAACSTAVAAIFPLNTERAAVDRAVDSLAAKGGLTYSALGVLWAQRMLEPKWKGRWGTNSVHPADSATPEYSGLRKAIVLLTDGEDTYCGHRNEDCSGNALAISRTNACTLAKARGTEVFVITAMRPDKVSTALGQGLRKCSSENDRAYPDGTRRPGATYVFLNNATPASLEAAFTDIANQLRSLRKVH